MALLINLRHLEAKPLELEGELSLGELDIQTRDPLIHLHGGLTYQCHVERLNEGLLVQGSLYLPLECNCARCLRPFEYSLELDPWNAHVPLEGEDAAPVVNDCVDLTPYIRDDILLSFPQHPLCEPECKGLPGIDNDLAHGGERKPEMTSPAWAELNKLKL